MPFVVPQPQQPQRTSGHYDSERRDYSGERRDYGRQQPQYAPPPQPQYSSRPYQRQQQYGPGYRPQPQQSMGYGYRPPQPQQYRPPQYQQPYYQPQPQRRDYNRYREPMPQYSNRPQQGNYVGEGVYADGTPMPPPTMTNNQALSLIQSNAGPSGGVYANFQPTPTVMTTEPVYDESNTYNKRTPTSGGRSGY